MHVCMCLEIYNIFKEKNMADPAGTSIYGYIYIHISINIHGNQRGGGRGEGPASPKTFFGPGRPAGRPAEEIPAGRDFRAAAGRTFFRLAGSRKKNLRVG